MLPHSLIIPQAYNYENVLFAVEMIRLLQQPDDAQVHEYEGVTLFCSYSSYYDEVQIVWERENGELPEKSRTEIIFSRFRPKGTNKIFIVINFVCFCCNQVLR